VSHARLLLPLLGLALLAGCPRAAQESPRPCAKCEQEVTTAKAKLLVAERRADGKDVKEVPWKIVNYHDHLYQAHHADKYIAAARATGVAKTVFCASSNFTIFGKGHDRSKGYDETFQEILKASKRYPGEIFPQSSVYPPDPNALEMLKRHHRLGSVGLKLYNGHSNFYEKEHGLVPAGFDKVLEYCQEYQLPIFWHVRFGPYLAEFEDKVLTKYPNLVVVVAHYGVAFWRPAGKVMDDLPRLLDTYPNLYFDMSLGTRKILVGGLAMMSRHIEKFRALINKYPDRFTMGTDMVVTGNKEKTESWVARVIWAVRDQLEKERFQTDFAAKWSVYRPKKGTLDYDGTMKGMGLSNDVLKMIYETTPNKLLAMPKPAD